MSDEPAIYDYTYELHAWVCNRCHHHWYPRLPRLPKMCPRCKSPYWNKPRVFPKREKAVEL